MMVEHSDQTAQMPDFGGRKFMAVLDGTDECWVAVTFAAYRMKRTGGIVKLLVVIEPDDFQHWIGVEDVMRAEAYEQANQWLDEAEAKIAQIGDIEVEREIREGRTADEIEELISEDKNISILVLASSTSTDGPGPLVSTLAARGANALPIPIAIVPGILTDSQIAELA